MSRIEDVIQALELRLIEKKEERMSEKFTAKYEDPEWIYKR